MSAFPRCHLTARDYTRLQKLLGQPDSRRDEAYLRLLRSKLDTAIVMFPGDIDPWVAAIGSRVKFTANAGLPQSCILVDDERGGRSGPESGILPVTTHWGLALLGLVAGQTIRIEDPGGGPVRLRLEKVTVLPRRPAGEERAAAGGRRSGATVLAFARPAASPQGAHWLAPADPDDDPGPSAA